MPAQLLALTDGPSILLDKPILLFGRHPECDIQLNSRKVSRKHCCIALVRDYLVVRDLGSTNGIRINGHRTLVGKLRSGDELTIGNFRYQVWMEGTNDAPRTTTAQAPPPAVAPNPAVASAARADAAAPESGGDSVNVGPAIATEAVDIPYPGAARAGKAVPPNDRSAPANDRSAPASAKSVSPIAINDELLEEADEPIPLD